MPRTSEKMNEMTIDSSQNAGYPPPPNRADGLYETNSDLRERGKPERFTMEQSVYQQSKLHPILTGALAVGAGLGIAAWISSRKKYTDGYDTEPTKSLDTTKSFDASQIGEHAEVLSADGQHIGTIDSVEGERIKLTRKDSTDAKHHFIPLSWVASASGGEVRLNRNAYVVREHWGTENRTDEDASNIGQVYGSAGGF